MKTVAKNTQGQRAGQREVDGPLSNTAHFPISCLSYFFLHLGRFPFTKNFEKLPWRGLSSEERVPFDTSSIFSCSRDQNLR